MALTVRPDRRASLADGVVVDATILARLLGLKLLKLTAHVTLMPARFERTTYLEPVSSASPAVVLSPAGLPAAPVESGTLTDAAELLAHAARTMRETARDEARDGRGSGDRI